MAIDQELPELTAAVSLLATDIFYIVRDPNGLNEDDMQAAVSLLDARFQPLDSDLSAIAALSSADGNFIVGSAGGWVAESGATARASLGVDPAGTDNSTPVTLAGSLDYITLSGQQITRNAIDLATDITGALPIANGGSGQTSQQAAIDALTAVSGATDEYVLTKDTASGNAVWKAATGGGAALTIQEVDGTPTIANVDTIVVSNGTLTDDGGGQVTIAIGSGSALPVADTTAIVEGSADDTKLLRFEVDGFTTGTTRVLTPPDADITLAGQNFANTFTAEQTISVATLTTRALHLFSTDNNLTTPIMRVSMGQVWDLGPVSGGNWFSFSQGSVGGIAFGQNRVQGVPFSATSASEIQFVDDAGNSNNQANIRISLRGTADRFEVHERNAIARLFSVLGSGISFHLGLDAVTAAVTDVLTVKHNTSGTPAAGYGTGLLLQGESSTTEDQAMARVSALWATATHASRKARSVWSVYDTAEREGIRIEASGTAPMLGVLGAAAIARQAHIADPSGGGTQDTEARTAINAILAALESFGFLATS